MMLHHIHARMQPGRDDDLIAWLEGQTAGGHSEAIRALLRDGLRMRQMESSVAAIVRQAVTETLDGLQISAAQQQSSLGNYEVEESFELS